jgi:hypothetical protein
VCTASDTCACASHASSECYQGNLYWYDSCGNRETLETPCSLGCANDACILPITVTLQWSGSGTLAIAGQPTCVTSPCSYQFPPSTPLTLTATPGAQQFFGGWGGACSGFQTSCAVTPPSSVTISASFGLPNRVFVTSAVFKGDFGGIAAADAACTAAASGKIAGHFKAYISDDTAPSAIARLGTARGWARSDGKPVLDTPDDIVLGQGWYAPLLDENGNAVYDGAWTGSFNGNGQGYHCTNWTSQTAGIANGTGGYVQGAVKIWSGSFNTGCGASEHLLCFGVDRAVRITVAPTPGRLAFLSDGGFTPSSGRGQADALCASEASAAGPRTISHRPRQNLAIR